MIIDPDNELADDVRGAVADAIWTGREVYDTFAVGEPPRQWFIAGCEVHEAVYRRHAELAEAAAKPSQAHKVFVSELGGLVNIEMVTDGQPPVRLTLALLSDEARGVAAALRAAANGVDETERAGGGQSGPGWHGR